MYKAIFVDIDGTLVDEQKNISTRTKIAIENAKKLGIEIFICTGRQCNSARKFRDEIGANRYVVCTNGAQIYDLEKNIFLFNSYIDGEESQKLCKLALENNMILKIDVDDFRLVNKDVFCDDYVDEIKDFYEITQKNKISHISISDKDANKIKLIEDYIENCRYTKIENKFIRMSKNDKYITVHCMNKNSSKGNAMAGLCKFLKIDLNDVIAIGDQKNDISMIKMAKLGVAMGNAEDLVKQSADIVTDTNENDGVAKVIEKIIKNKS